MTYPPARLTVSGWECDPLPASFASQLTALGSAQFDPEARGYIHTRRPWSSGAINVAGPNSSTGSIITAEGPFDAVQGVLSCVSGGSITGAKAIVAPSAKLGALAGWNPVDAADAAVAATALTWSTSGAVSKPPHVDGNAATGAVPAGLGAIGSNAINESHYFSDWVPLQSIDRADAGESLPLLFYMVEHPLATTPHGINAGNTNTNAWTTDANVHKGRVFWGKASTGLDTATPQSSFTSLGNNGLSGLAAVRFLMRYRGLSVISLIDSIGAGVGSQGTLTSPYGYRSYGHLACANVSQGNRPVTFGNFSVPGGTSALALARLDAIARLYLPDVLLLAPTPNDGTNESDWSTLALTASILCWSLGIVPVFATQIPSNSTGPNETARQNRNAFTRNLKSRGHIVVDMEAAVIDPATPNRMKAAYTNDPSFVHPNDAGYDAMAERLAVEGLARILAR